MVNELGPAVVFIHTFPKEAKGDEMLKVGTAAEGVTSVQLVPALISSISTNGVFVALSCLKNILSIPVAVKSVPDTAVAPAAGSLPPKAGFNQILETSFVAPAIIS